MFTSDPDQLRAGEGNGVMQPVAGPESVLLLDGKRHLNRRKLMLPPFHGERMGVYADLIGEIADEEIASWPVGKPFSAHTSMQRITLRVILRAVLGIEDAARAAELERLLPKLLNSPALLWPFLQRDMGARSPWRRFVALREHVDEILFDEIARKRSDPKLAEHEDILSMLLGARDAHGEAMTDEELRDQLVTLLLAGHETTATGLAWIFERVLRTPEVHARLRTAVAEDDDRYLDCLIKEGLRLRPVVPLVARQVNSPFAVGDYTVPPGTLLTCSMILTHSRPDLYPEPEAFRPERFMEDAPDTYTWLPFGGGTRRCIGAAFATLEMKVILRHVFAQCELEAPDAKPERPRRRFVTYPPNRGAQVLLEEQTRSLTRHGNPARPPRHASRTITRTMRAQTRAGGQRREAYAEQPRRIPLRLRRLLRSVGRRGERAHPRAVGTRRVRGCATVRALASPRRFPLRTQPTLGPPDIAQARPRLDDHRAGA